MLSRKINVSVTFLSLLENGKKQIPLDYIEKISIALNLNIQERKELENAVLVSNRRIIIELDNLTKDQLEVSLLFGSKIEDLTEFQVNNIKNIIKGEN